MPTNTFWYFVILFIAIVIVSTVINLKRQQTKNARKFISKEKRLKKLQEQHTRSKLKFWKR